jgi:F-type H+-transporting ATPase subunit delta
VAERATIARPYAKAAFDFARAAHTFPGWSQGLGLAAAVVADARVGALVKDPERTPADIAGFITDIAGSNLDAGMQNFVRVLAENRRLLLLPEIAAQFAALRAEAENTVDVEVISTRLKRQVRMQNSVDSSLLGGAVIRAGDLVIDGSLKGRLERLGTELAS